MKNQINVFCKASSLVLATCILFASCITFQGCSYKEDYSVLKENNQVPKVLKSTKLSKADDLVVSLKKSLSNIKNSSNIKSAYIDVIGSKFGILNWDDSQLTTYDNGLSAIYIPLLRENKITAFLLSIPRNNGFKSVILEISSRNIKGDKQFDGEIKYYSLSGRELASLTFVDGKYISSLKSANISLVRLKSAQAEGDNCDLTCMRTCLDNALEELGNTYMFLCGLACGAWETGVGAVFCAACLGGPALHCILECCVDN